MCHQTVLAFPAAREEIPAFFLTLILCCSALWGNNTRCAYLLCPTQVFLEADPEYTKEELERKKYELREHRGVKYRLIQSAKYVHRNTEINAHVHTQTDCSHNLIYPSMGGLRQALKF